MTNQISQPEQLKKEILALGFHRVGFTPAESPEDLERFSGWLKSGRAAGMEWMERHAELRGDPCLLLPEARSLIMVSLNYHQDDHQDPSPTDRGRISCYARGRDYHKVIRKRLRDLDILLREKWGAGHTRICVDSAPLLERSFAHRAGLGWVGRNTMLIDRELGSWTFLGALLCDLELPADSPVVNRCGECRACLDACPTNALDDDGLDARRCLSYLTIEHRGDIPESQASAMDNLIFGCDICQEACPWNRATPASDVADFRTRPVLQGPLLTELSDLNDDRFLARFAGTPVMRAGAERMDRNVKIALANGMRSDSKPKPGK
jgi:epoxyqueuosine reductase